MSVFSNFLTIHVKSDADMSTLLKHSFASCLSERQKGPRIEKDEFEKSQSICSRWNLDDDDFVKNNIGRIIEFSKDAVHLNGTLFLLSTLSYFHEIPDNEKARTEYFLLFSTGRNETQLSDIQPNLHNAPFIIIKETSSIIDLPLAKIKRKIVAELELRSATRTFTIPCTIHTYLNGSATHSTIEVARGNSSLYGLNFTADASALVLLRHMIQQKLDDRGYVTLGFKIIHDERK